MSLALSLCQYVLRPWRGLAQASPGLAWLRPGLGEPRSASIAGLHQHNRKGKIVMIKTRRYKRLVFGFVFCTWNWYDFWRRSWGLPCKLWNKFLATDCSMTGLYEIWRQVCQWFGFALRLCSWSRMLAPGKSMQADLHAPRLPYVLIIYSLLVVFVCNALFLFLLLYFFICTNPKQTLLMSARSSFHWGMSTFLVTPSMCCVFICRNIATHWRWA